jgi:hypothetical protein
MYIRKSNGPRIVPCGTTCFMSSQSEDYETYVKYKDFLVSVTEIGFDLIGSEGECITFF